MNPKIRTREVTRNLYANYLKRSDECFAAAKESLQKGDWNATAICAIHSCIAASDAMCVYFLGKRHAGQNHGDAVVLLGTIKSGDEESKDSANKTEKDLVRKEHGRV